MTQLKIVKGDITKMEVDAIVNAANASLIRGGGVDGAIHRAAGPKLQEECNTLKGCKPGKCKMTKAYDLPSKYVIHAVGPIWYGGGMKEATTLADCYWDCLRKAALRELRTIAFPSISTGAYGYPLKKASKIAVDTVREYISRFPDAFDEITFVAFDTRTLNAYKRLLEEKPQNLSVDSTDGVL